jgi:hypothetical protein
MLIPFSDYRAPTVARRRTANVRPLIPVQRHKVLWEAQPPLNSGKAAQNIDGLQYLVPNGWSSPTSAVQVSMAGGHAKCHGLAGMAATNGIDPQKSSSETGQSVSIGR